MPHRLAQTLVEQKQRGALGPGAGSDRTLVRALLDRLHTREPLFYSAFHLLLTHHLLDSLAVLPALRRHLAGRAARVLDVGSGGGLPGVVLALMQPELSVTCVDTVGKKASFIRQVAGDMKLRNLVAEHARVEALRLPAFDVVTSRAFASLGDFTRLTRALVGPQGVWMAMKGKLPTEEMAALPAECDVFHVEQLAVPGLDAERCLLWIRPILAAPAKASA